jgi:hypothetical protein
MRKIFQTIVDKRHGNCMQAAIASLFDLELEEVPNFIEYQNWYTPLMKFLPEQGYHYDGMLHNKSYVMLCTPTHECFKELKWHRPTMVTKKKLYKEQGVNGLFFASVLSPKYFNYTSGFTATHAVLIDKDYNIVHDPNPAYQEILNYPLANLLGYNGIIDVYLINPVPK